MKLTVSKRLDNILLEIKKMCYVPIQIMIQMDTYRDLNAEVSATLRYSIENPNVNLLHYNSVPIYICADNFIMKKGAGGIEVRCALPSDINNFDISART